MNEQHLLIEVVPTLVLFSLWEFESSLKLSKRNAPWWLVTAVIAAVVFWSLPDEAEVNSQRAVDARAVDAQEHTIWDTGPAGVFGGTVKTNLNTNSMHTSLTSEW